MQCGGSLCCRPIIGCLPFTRHVILGSQMPAFMWCTFTFSVHSEGKPIDGRALHVLLFFSFSPSPSSVPFTLTSKLLKYTFIKYKRKTSFFLCISPTSDVNSAAEHSSRTPIPKDYLSICFPDKAPITMRQFQLQTQVETFPSQGKVFYVCICATDSPSSWLCMLSIFLLSWMYMPII